MRKQTILYIALVFTILWFPSLLAQEYPKFPISVDSSYFAEDYLSTFAHAQDFMVSIKGKPGADIRGENIRFAYFAVWFGRTDCIDVTKAVVDKWKQSYPNWNDSIKLPPHENADYHAIKAVLANIEGKATQAIENIESAIGLRVLNTQLDSAIQADAYQFLGRLLKNRFYHAKAVSNYRESIRLNTKIGRDHAIPGIILEKSSAELEANPKDPQILEDIKSALKYHTENSNYYGTGYAENELGNYWLIQEDYFKAIDHFKNYMNIKLRTNADGVNIAYNNISAAYTHLDEPDSVLYYMRASLKATSQDKLFQVALLNSNMGATYGVLNKPDSALFYFKKALKILFPEEPVDDINYNPNPKDFPIILPRVLTNKGNALFQLSKKQDEKKYLEASLKTMKIAIAQFNQIREMSSYENKHIFARESRDYYFLALKIAASYYKQYPTIENYNLVIKYAQQSKSAVFNEFQRILLVQDKLEIDKNLIARDDSLKLLKSETNQELFAAQRAGNTPDEINKLYAQIVILDQQISQTKNTIQTNHPAYSKYIFNPDPISLDSIRSTLQQNETLVDFTISDSLMIVLAINKQHQVVNTVKISDEFNNHVAEYLKLLSVQSGTKVSRFVKLGHEFYNTLIQPIDSMIANHEIVIIPDGIIGYLPFDTFSTDSLVPKRKHYNELSLLIKEHVIRYLNSIEQLTKPNTNHHEEILSIGAFAPFTKNDYNNGDIHLGRLKGSRKEIYGIAKSCNISKFVGSKATLRNFKEEIGKPGIIHLATHGLLSEGNPMNNRVLFYQNGPKSDLPLYQAILMPIKSKMIVLSACETGAGDLQEGEGVMSLTRGFHNAGTESLIMSLWPAYDQPSAVIMEIFYRELQTNKSVSEAIHQAKLEYLKNASSSNSHPGFWANYQLSGSDSYLNIETPQSKKWIFILIIGIVILMSGGIIILRRKSHR